MYHDDLADGLFTHQGRDIKLERNECFLRRDLCTSKSNIIKICGQNTRTVIETAMNHLLKWTRTTINDNLQIVIFSTRLLDLKSLLMSRSLLLSTRLCRLQL